MKIVKLIFLTILTIVINSVVSNADYKILIDHTCTNLSKIPNSAIITAKSNLHIAYQHTSHGSQLITGMNALKSYPDFGNKYAWSDNGSSGLDLDDYGIPGEVNDLSAGDYIDSHGVTPWVTSTRLFLDKASNSHINVIVWSWCSINGHDIQRYVTNMEILISEYGRGGSKVSPTRPPVDFVFMTGHAEGEGIDLTPGSVHYNNERVRAHCRTNNRILYDFADIEAYDPGNPNTPENPGYHYFWDQNMNDNLDYSGGNWATEWLARYPTAESAKLTTGAGVPGYRGCSGCAHSSSPSSANLNCVLKGRAAFWLWARLAGWNSFSANYNYYVPVFKPQPAYWSGFGIANLNGSTSSSVIAKVYNSNGIIMETSSVTIPASGQTSFIIGARSTNSGWIKISSDKKLAGLNFLGKYNSSDYYIADVPFTDVLSTLLIIPHVAQNSIWETIICVANPNASATTAIFTYKSPGGTAFPPYSTPIAANGSKQILSSIITGGSSLEGGTVTISSSQGLAAFALYNNLKTGNYSYAGINAVDISK